MDLRKALNGKTDTINLKAGTWNASDKVNITQPIKIIGDGLGRTVLNSTAETGLNILTEAPVIIRDLDIYVSGQYGIFVSDGGSSQFGNCDSKFDNVRIFGGDYGIYFHAANHWDLTNAHLLNQAQSCVVVDNVRHGDAGDSGIVGSELWAHKNAIASVIQYAGGGLKIAASKLAGGGALDSSDTTQFGYVLDLQNRYYGTANGTSILTISGCSLEAHKIASILLQNNSDYKFYTAKINDNQVRGGLVINHPQNGNDSIQYVDINTNTIFGHVQTGDSGIAIGGGDIINVTGNTIDCRGEVGYGISNGGGRVWEANNIILRPRVSKRIGLFERY